MLDGIITWLHSIFSYKKCNECGVKLFPCSICGCEYDSEDKKKHCENWCKILKHETHQIHHSHKDMEDE